MVCRVLNEDRGTLIARHTISIHILWYNNAWLTIIIVLDKFKALAIIVFTS